jgi:hypothetical protein
MKHKQVHTILLKHQTIRYFRYLYIDGNLITYYQRKTNIDETVTKFNILTYIVI